MFTISKHAKREERLFHWLYFQFFFSLRESSESIEQKKKIEPQQNFFSNFLIIF